MNRTSVPDPLYKSQRQQNNCDVLMASNCNSFACWTVSLSPVPVEERLCITAQYVYKTNAKYYCLLDNVTCCLATITIS
jgi:hypothetical protein